MQEILETQKSNTIFIQHNLTIETTKLQVCMNEIEFLCFTLISEGYHSSKGTSIKYKKLFEPKNKKGAKYSLDFQTILCVLFKIILK